MSNIVIVASKFNFFITERLVNSAVATWQNFYNEKAIPEIFYVPGAVEIPLMSSWVIDKIRPEAVVCLGAVIQGDSAHFEYVCQQVSSGCQQVSLEFKVPVVFGVLTVKDVDQALQRTGGMVVDNGKEAMLTAIKMIENKNKLLKGIENVVDKK
jgi:6,7-dimethyl-8-ribityllumazine synthase